MFNVSPNKTLEDLLFEKKLISSQQLYEVKGEKQTSGRSSEQIFKEKNFTSADVLAENIGELYGIEYTALAGVQIAPELLELIPEALARRYNIVPFALVDSKLSLAMVDPFDLQTIEFVERKTGYKVLPYITTQKNIEKILEDQKGKAIGEEISAALEEINQTTLKIEENQGDLASATLRDAPIARIVGMILETAVKTGASDIHLEPTEDKSRIRYRIDGVLEEKRFIPKEMHDSIVTRIKIMGKMKIDEKRLPQDGRFKVQVGTLETDVRVSTLPTIFGEKVVIRLLKDEGTIYSFKDLGMRGLTLRRFEEAILRPTGMILVTGPTGSGKTVTLASALSKLNTVRVNIVSLEDPVEIRVSGVNQVQMNPQAGLTFADGLRSVLRQDPNIVMVGEIRDSETAELAVQAALTGHLVLSTLHTNSAAGAIPRLLDMGVENFLLSSTVNVVLAQRLVRRVCPHCKEGFDIPNEVATDIEKVIAQVEASKTIMSKDPEVAAIVKGYRDAVGGKKPQMFRGKGCEKCDHGYRGRVGIFELLQMNEEVAHLTLENSSALKIEATAIAGGMLTLLQDGYLRVLEGATTLEEVLRVAN